MRKLLKAFQQRQNDHGDAILVMSVILVPFFFLTAGFAMDLTKAVYVKQQYQIMSQEATTAAARNIDSSGSLTPQAAAATVRTYTERYSGARNDSREGTSGGRGVCPTVETPDGVKRAPYMVITINGGRNGDGVQPVIYKSEAGSIPTVPSAGNFAPGSRYYSIKATIYDASPNLILGMFNRPCQNITSDVSSISFGSQEDLNDFQDPESEEFETAPPFPWSGDGVDRYYKCTWDSNNRVRWTAPAGGVTEHFLVGANNSYTFAGVDQSSPVTITNPGNWKGYVIFADVPTGGTMSISCANPNFSEAPAPKCPTGLMYASSTNSVITWSYPTGFNSSNVKEFRITGKRGTETITRTVPGGTTSYNLTSAFPAYYNPTDLVGTVRAYEWRVNLVTNDGQVSTGCGYLPEIMSLQERCPTIITVTRSIEESNNTTTRLHVVWTSTSASGYVLIPKVFFNGALTELSPMQYSPPSRFVDVPTSVFNSSQFYIVATPTSTAAQAQYARVICPLIVRR